MSVCGPQRKGSANVGQEASTALTDDANVSEQVAAVAKGEAALGAAVRLDLLMDGLHVLVEVGLLAKGGGALFVRARKRALLEVCRA